MDAGDLLAMGLGSHPLWGLGGRRVDTGKPFHEVLPEVTTERGAKCFRPVRGARRKARDFHKFIQRHFNFFQYHCHVIARWPRVECPDNKIKRGKTPWARWAVASFCKAFIFTTMIYFNATPLGEIIQLHG